MHCPKCGHAKSTCKDTRRHAHGMRRHRVCLACGHGWRTSEIAQEEHNSLLADHVKARAVQHPVAALATAPPPTVIVASPVLQVQFDLESELESLLSPALVMIRQALAEPSPNAVKVRLAQWVVEDRRAARQEVAHAKQGQDDSDGLLALANVLNALPYAGVAN